MQMQGAMQPMQQNSGRAQKQMPNTSDIDKAANLLTMWSFVSVISLAYCSSPREPRSQ